MDFFYLEQGEVWEQNRARHFLNIKYLKSYKRAIKKIPFFFFCFFVFFKKKMNKTCINALIMIRAFKQKSPTKFSTDIHFK